MAIANAQESAIMGNEGKQVRDRRLRLGMTIDDLAKEAGVSPDTLGDFEAGNRRPRELTVSKVFAALDRIEEEVGMHAPPAVTEATSPEEPRIVEFDVTGPSDFHIVVKGPVQDAEALQRQVVEIVIAMRKAEKDSPESGS